MEDKKINDILEELFKNNKYFLDNEGKINKFKIKNLAIDDDEKLIGLLLDNEEIKRHFFKKLSGVLIFKQRAFINFIETKNSFDLGYTKYRNKIGLTISGKYLNEYNKIALFYPFKDCVLKGGAKNEDKSKEIFYNELLDYDQTQRLFDKKVLVNFSKIDKEGENKDFKLKRNEDGLIKDNLLIKGNNLLALHSLKSNFAGKVKLIYIDPPYNTGNDSFNYNDNFNHSSWLVFMKNRLEIAKELLRDDGVIFVQCDDNEQAYLKVLMDEIFARDNFLDTIFVLNNLKGNNNTEYISNVGEYIIFFAKNKKDFKLNELKVKDEDEIFLWDEDEKGYWKKGRNLKATGENAPREKRPTMYFPLYISDDNKFSLNKDEKYHYELYPITKGKDMCWNWSKDKFINEKDEVLIFRKGDKINIYKKQRPELKDLITKKPKNIFYNPSYSNTKSAEHIEELFDKKVFLYSKSEFLIKDLIEISTEKEDIVLDFFAGSGTTLAVAHKMNRQYIGIEQMDYIKDITKERLKKVIEGEQGGVSKDLRWEGGRDFVYLELKEYNQRYIDMIQSADESNIIDIYRQIKEKAFLNYDVDIKELDKEEDFKELALEEKKKSLISILNKNALYLNLSEIDDEDFEVDKKTKDFNKDFYNE